jgi:MFS family permease
VSQDTLTPKRGLHRALPFDAELLGGGLGRYLCGTLLGAFGSGFTFALFVLYCVHLRHLSDVSAGLILTLEAGLSIAISPLYGTLTDRHGPSRVLTWCLPVAAVALGSIGFAPSFVWIVVVMTVFSLTGAGMWSASTVLLTRLIAEEHRTDAFGLNFMLLNVGIGLGSICGALIVNLHDLVTFQIVYLVSGSFFAANAVVLFTLRRHGGPPGGP